MKKVKNIIIAIVSGMFQEGAEKLFSVTEKIKVKVENNFAGRSYVDKLIRDGDAENFIFEFVFSRGGGNRNGGGKYVTLMSTFYPVIKAAINAPEDAEGRAKCAEHIQTAAAKTLYITIPPLLYGSVLTDFIKAMRDAVGANQVDKAWHDLNGQLKKILVLVQAAMDEDVTDSAAIICEYYSFHVIGKGGKSIQVFSGEEGVAAGEIVLVLPKGADGCCYDIKLWNADRTTFTRAQPSDITHATIGGLVSGSTQNVSVAEILHGKLVRESQIIAVKVK